MNQLNLNLQKFLRDMFWDLLGDFPIFSDSTRCNFADDFVVMTIEQDQIKASQKLKNHPNKIQENFGK